MAKEKAGVIKPHTPVIIGERGEVAHIFEEKAKNENAKIIFAEDIDPAKLYDKIEFGKMDLKGDCQKKNLKTVCEALNILSELDYIYNISNIEKAAKLTGLHGRWEKLQEEPLVICDTGHNAHGFKLLKEQIERVTENKKESQTYMVFGVVADKDLDKIIELLPRDAYYYFVNARGIRALKAEKLGEKMMQHGFKGEIVEATNSIGESVNEGLDRALEVAKKEDFIFIGGSTFVVAEVLEKKL